MSADKQSPGRRERRHAAPSLPSEVALVFALGLLFLPNIWAMAYKGQFSLCHEGCTCIACQYHREQSSGEYSAALRGIGALT